MPHATASIPLPEDLARELPAELEERQAVLELGLREWRIRRALEAIVRGTALWRLPPARRAFRSVK